MGMIRNINLCSITYSVWFIQVLFDHMEFLNMELIYVYHCINHMKYNIAYKWKILCPISMISIDGRGDKYDYSGAK